MARPEEILELGAVRERLAQAMQEQQVGPPTLSLSIPLPSRLPAWTSVSRSIHTGFMRVSTCFRVCAVRVTLDCIYGPLPPP